MAKLPQADGEATVTQITHYKQGMQKRCLSSLEWETKVLICICSSKLDIKKKLEKHLL